VAVAPSGCGIQKPAAARGSASAQARRRHTRAALAVIVVWRMLRRHRFASFPLARLLSAPLSRLTAPAGTDGRRGRRLLLIALALSEPVLPYSERKVTSRGVDLALVLDLSSSMQELMGGKQGAATVSSQRKRR